MLDPETRQQKTGEENNVLNNTTENLPRLLGTQTPNSTFDIELLSKLLMRLCLPHCHQPEGGVNHYPPVRQHFWMTPVTERETFARKELKPILFSRATGSITHFMLFYKAR